MDDRDKIDLTTLTAILISETEKRLGRNAHFLRDRIEFSRRDHERSWDANIVGALYPAAVIAFGQAVTWAQELYQLDEASSYGPDQARYDTVANGR